MTTRQILKGTNKATFDTDGLNKYAVIISNIQFGKHVEYIAGFVYEYGDTEKDATEAAEKQGRKQYGKLMGYKYERVRLVN